MPKRMPFIFRGPGATPPPPKKKVSNSLKRVQGPAKQGVVDAVYFTFILFFTFISESKMAEANPRDGYFSMGLNTLKVPVQLFIENRKKICEYEKLKKTPSLSVPSGSVNPLAGRRRSRSVRG